MPGNQQTLENVGLRASLLAAGRFLVSCEHASSRIPAPYAGLGLALPHRRSHIAWDPGARLIARICAKVLRCPCHEGRYSRLLIDLNRSLHHPRLMAKQSFGVRIPGNQGISQSERQERVERYYTPYRTKVLENIGRIIGGRGPCIHLSIHSFVPLGLGIDRKADVGLLYDPHRPSEKALALHLSSTLKALGLHVRRNYPYRGIADGFTTFCRRLFDGGEYCGLEIEVNQRLLGDPRGARRVARLIGKALGDSGVQPRKDMRAV